MSADVRFTFEGREITARAGVNLGSALAAAGEHALRETRLGETRGMYCGMGVCQDCLVEVDGVPNRRACMTKAASGMVVRRQRFPGALPDRARGAPPIGVDDIPIEIADVVVVGGGAGGLSAALSARRSGLDVLLLDERSIPGGQYFKQASGDLPPLDAQQREGQTLRAAVEDAGVRLRDSVEVWSPFDGIAVLATQAGRTFIARGKALVVATGAYERAHVAPGWTLPGVMTTGAMQTLWRSSRVLPGKRILIGGNGPLNLQVASELIAGGADICAVIEAAPIMSPTRIPAMFRMAFADFALTRRGVSLMRAAKVGGAALRFGHVIRGITATENGLTVETGPLAGGSGERWAVDVVGMGYGFQPSNELLRALGAEHRYDADTGILRTVRDPNYETRIKNLFAVGDCARIGGAPAAMAEGEIVGAAIAQRFGGKVDKNALSKARSDLARSRRFQKALWSLYAAPRASFSLADDDTLVCRCEEITKREAFAAMADGAATIGEVKRRTRCGMGRCQGRYCGPLLVEELARRSGAVIDERDGFAPRGPVKPVAISDLVGRGSL